MKRMYADFDDEAYEDYLNGDALFNNGFRARKGNYHPKQPDFTPLDYRQEKVKDARVDLQIMAEDFIVRKIFLPAVENLFWDHVAPFCSRKWNDLKTAAKEKFYEFKARKRKCRETDSTAEEGVIESPEVCNVVNFSDYRKCS